MRIKESIRKLIFVIPVLIGMLLPALFYFHFQVDKEETQLLIPRAVRISNQSLPTSKLIEIRSNADFTEKVRNGKVLLIFLASNCNACKKDVELISRIYPKLSSEVQIYGISIENKEAMLNFISEKNLQFPVLVDSDTELLRKLSIRYFPTKFLIKNGVITKTFFGNFPNEKKLYEDLEVGD